MSAMEISKIQDHVPSAYLAFIKCSIYEADTKGQTLVAICTSNGQLLEFSDKKLVNGCEIDCSDAISLQNFHSYNPYNKYYLVQTSSQVIVVKRQKELKVHKIFDDILSVQIKDKLGLGRPQIVMEVSDEEPIITDLVGTLEPCDRPQVQSQMSLTLRSKLQEVSLRFSTAKNLLQEKRICRTNAMIQFSGHPRERSCSKEAGLVTVLGQFQQRNTTLHPPSQSSRIQVSLPWQRIYFNKWIIGVPVHNSCMREVRDIGLLLNREDESTLQYRTYFFVFPQVDEPGVRWTEILPKPTLFHPDSDLPGNTSGVIICVMDEPNFLTGSSIKLSGVVIFKESINESESLQQVHFSPIELRVSDLVQGRLRSFLATTSNELDCDLLSCVVVCRSTKLEVLLMPPSHYSLESGLEENLGFVKLSSLDYYVCKLCGALEDIIVNVERPAPWQYTLTVHTSEDKKTMLFIHSLRNILPQHAKVNKLRCSPSTIQDAAKSLDEEMLLMLNTLSSCNKKETPLLDTSLIELSEGSWNALREQLLKQELTTDQLFNKLPGSEIR